MHHIRDFSVYLRLCILFQAALIIFSACHVHAEDNSLFIPLNISQSEYHVGDTVHGDSITPPSSDEIWNPVSKFKYAQLTGHHSLWIRCILPDIKSEDSAVLITAFVNGLSVFQGAEPIYSYGDDPENPGNDIKYHMSHLIPLEPVKKQTFLHLRIPYSDRTGIGEIISLTVGHPFDLTDLMIAERDTLYRISTIDVCLGFLLAVTGVACMFIFAVRFRERDYPFLSFGAFCLFSGATYLSDFNSLFFLNFSPSFHYYLKSVAFLLVPVGLFSFVGHMFTSRHSCVIRCIWVFHLFFAVLSLFMIRHSIDYTYFILAVLILNSMICIYVILTSETRTYSLIKVSFIVFLIVFIVLIGIHFLELINIIPSSYDIFGWGMLAFVFVLGYFLVKHYTKTFYAMQTVSLELEKNKFQILELQKENLISQLEALKNQIDPHFLFNNFSTLSSIIEDDKITAVHFVHELSRVYRYVLQTRINSLVTLKEEIDFIESYKFLMAKRFGENLKLMIRVPSSYHLLYIIPFSLQLLVENAIKHNIISQKKPLTIEIDTDENWLFVKNKLQKKNQPVRSTHVGLENIRNRYRLITGKDICIEETDSEFTVRIPVIEHKGETDESPDH